MLPKSYLRASKTAHPDPSRWIAGCDAPSLAEALDSLFQLPKIEAAEAHLVVGPGLDGIACDGRRRGCNCLAQRTARSQKSGTGSQRFDVLGILRKNLGEQRIGSSEALSTAIILSVIRLSVMPSTM